jgi:hypothetical protein
MVRTDARDSDVPHEDWIEGLLTNVRPRQNNLGVVAVVPREKLRGKSFHDARWCFREQRFVRIKAETNQQLAHPLLGAGSIDRANAR